MDHLVRGFETTERAARRDIPIICVALVEDVNEIVSHIVNLNGKIWEFRRKNKHVNKSLQWQWLKHSKMFQM